MEVAVTEMRRERVVNGKALERWLANHTPCTEAFCDHVARALRPAGLMPLGGRGIQAPRITEEHVVNMLTAVAVADTPAQAPVLVPIYLDLPATWTWNFGTGEPEQPLPYYGHPTFRDAFTALLLDDVYRMKISEVLIYRSWPRVKIVGKEQIGYYGLIENPAAQAAGLRDTSSGLVFHYSSATIHQLAIDLAGHNPGILD
jgi:hypothetical protein